MEVFTTRRFRSQLKLAMDKVIEGEEVMIVRNGQLFVLETFKGAKGEQNTTV
jgi:hypothetical protein